MGANEESRADALAMVCNGLPDEQVSYVRGVLDGMRMAAPKRKEDGHADSDNEDRSAVSDR
jgi:hypothetical protein|nr:MAG TPA_asm: hypothetical protein [Caudoviricetes sp.]